MCLAIVALFLFCFVFLFCLFSFVCVWCLFMYVDMFTSMQLHMHVSVHVCGGQSLTSCFFHDFPPLYFLGQNLLRTLDLMGSASPAG